MNQLRLIPQLLFRNRFTRNGTKATRHRVNLEYYTTNVNLGDALAPVIYEWMLKRKNIQPDTRTTVTHHLMTVGSLIGGSGFFDATIWGSGIKSFGAACSLGKRKLFQKLDIRAVRGPITGQILFSCGYQCPEVYGDPGILMPLIYTPSQKECEKKRGGIGVVQHYLSHENIPAEIECIDIQTSDYRSFIDRIVKFDKIISSSLHGIILAESYGVPAVFLAKDRDSEMLKYYDWYISTGRRNVKMAESIEEAIQMEPMQLPALSLMQQDLLSTFPYDLWFDC